MNIEFEPMECSIDYTQDCSRLLSCVVITMLVFMISTATIIVSYMSNKSVDREEISSDDSLAEKSTTNYDTDTESHDESMSTYRNILSEDSDEGNGRVYGTRRRTNRYRDMDLLSHGQKIRYVYENRECLGMYNNKTRMFVNEKGKSFESPSAFAKNHLLEMRMNGKMKSDRETFEVNGWTHCECEVNGKWVYLDDYVYNMKKFLSQ